MLDPRQVFLIGAGCASDWAADVQVAHRWDDPSALSGMHVSALVGHLSRAITLVEDRLDEEPPDPALELVSAVTYFTTMSELLDPESNLNADIRARAAATGEDGHAAVAAAMREATDRLAVRLESEPAERRVGRWGLTMPLDQYLLTRIVELAVHLDDLAVSVGFDENDIPAELLALANHTMFEIAATRIGAPAALRALARRERASRALRAF